MLAMGFGIRNLKLVKFVIKYIVIKLTNDHMFISHEMADVSGVIQASSSGGEVTLDKRYSPSFRDPDSPHQPPVSKGSTKRKRDDVLR